MANNVEINIKQENGQYEVLYPQTLVENVIDIQDNYYTQEQTLQSSTSTLFGLGVEAVPNDILVKIKELLTSAQNTADAKAQIVTGSYVGTGKQGRSNPNNLTFGFVPQLLVVQYRYNSSRINGIWLGLFSPSLYTESYSNQAYRYSLGSTETNYYAKRTDTTVYWYSSSATDQFNESGTEYTYFALG